MDVPVRIEVQDDGAQIEVEWEDGAVETWSASRLRDACACADCRAGADKAPVPALRLMAPSATRIVGAELVGGYGVQFRFQPDGHATGIFTYGQLRSLGTPD